MRTRLLIRFVISVAVFVPFYLHSSNVSRLKILDELESFAYDARLHLTLPRTIDDRIVIVDIDETSLRAEGQWPWGRNKVARLVDNLFDRYDVRVVGFDVLFPEPDGGSGLPVLEGLAAGELGEVAEYTRHLATLRDDLDWDRVFADALRGRNTVLGYVFREADDFESVNVLPDPVLTQAEHRTRLDYPRPVSFTGSLNELTEAAAAGGFIDNPRVDADGAFRRVPVLQEYRGDLYESLALAVTRLALDSPKLEFVFHSGADGPRDGLDIEWLRIGDYRIPVDEESAVLIPYRGGQYHFPYVSATDVLSGAAAQYPLQGAIVLVGTSAAGLNDMRVTPVGRAYNGVEVQANIISGILDQRIKQHPRYVLGVEVVLMAVLGLLMTIIYARLPVITASLLTVLMAVILVGINLRIWSNSNFVVPIAAPLCFMFSIYLAHNVFGYITETRGRRALSTRFGQYIPPELVAEMGRNPADFNMESESREMSVMFSDVRGFTGIAEELEPRVLSQLMNEFLTPMTRVIHGHRGTIDKYMGDAIMAFWGAPLADEDHARNALLAAMEMQGAVLELQKAFAKRGWPAIRIGVGVNTGIMRVGDMGSQFRKAYTVMGDAVNLASRFEGLTKTYGVGIAVGEETAGAVPDYAFLELDRVRVRGKDTPVGIFEPIASRADLDSASAQMLREHRKALRAYRAGNWDSAESAFFSLQQSFPERRIFAIYLDRIAHFRSSPPPEDWDGVFTHAAK